MIIKTIVNSNWVVWWWDIVLMVSAHNPIILLTTYLLLSCYIKGNQVEIMPWNWVFYSAADSPSRHFLRSSCHPHTCSVQLFPPFISSLASSILNLCLSWKSFQLQRPTSSKPHRLLPAKSYIQVHAESPTEINGKRAAASPGGPHLLLLPLVLLTCFLTIWRVVVTASEQSTHSVAMTFLLACFTWRLNFLVLGPQINFSSVDVCNTHPSIECCTKLNFYSVTLEEINFKEHREALHCWYTLQ